ncbi:MAG: hypothetical protein IJR20_08600 [Muribaculaceae bacterium]|nr:hypothetical protein [Muribaculaceae bacterium]
MDRLFFNLIMAAVALMPLQLLAQGESASLQPKTDKHGFYSVVDCPTSLSFIKASTEEQDDGSYNVNIYRGKELSQTFNLEVTSGDLYYLDANFDGSMDILVGPAASRNYSTILLWDDKKGEFIPMEGSVLNGNMLVNPSKKILVSQGSGSYCSEYYTIYKWKGNKLITSETLVEITDSKAYKEYGVKRHYTVVKGDNLDKIATNKKLETNKKSKLPTEWRNILSAFGM